MPDIEKYRALIRAAESRFLREFSAHYTANVDLLMAYEHHLAQSVPLPEDEKAISSNPAAFEQAIATAHDAFVVIHPEFPAIEAEAIEIHVRRGDELERIKEAFMNEGGDEVSFRILHEYVLEGGGALKVIVPNPPSP